MADESRFRDIFILGSGFLLLFSAFAVVQNLASSVLPTDVAFWALGSLYVALALGNFLASWVVSRFGLRTSMVLGSLTFHLFVGANILVLTEAPHIQLATLLPTALFLGFGTSVLWNSQGAYLTRCSPGERLTLHMGVFYFLFVLSGVVGNLLAAVLVTHLTITYVYTTLLGVGVCGTMLLFLLRDAPPRDASPSDALNKSSRTSSFASSLAPLRRDSDTTASVRPSVLPAALTHPHYGEVVGHYGLDDPSGETGAAVPLAAPGLLTPAPSAVNVANVSINGSRYGTSLVPTAIPRAVRPPHIRSYSLPVSGAYASLLPLSAQHGIVSLATRRAMSWYPYDDEGVVDSSKLMEVLHVLTSPKALLLMLLVWFYGALQAFLFGSLPLYVDTDASHKLFLMAVVALVDALGSLLISRIADRVGRRWVLLVGGAVGMASMLLLALTEATNNLPVLFTVAVLYGLSDGALQTTIAVVAGHVFADKTVAGFATINFFEAVATGIAFFCSNVLLTEQSGSPLPRMELWVPINGTLFVGGMICLFILHHAVFSVEFEGGERLSLNDVEQAATPTKTISSESPTKTTSSESPTSTVSIESTPLLA